ncbi:metallophosphoesterase [Desulfosporosinus sp. BG]|uniref:metallophosphoesterase family protein n=1 Tax=Desulfosporosinus sp. BG TaxID=1633135 RepID=UPI00083A3DC0|nr:metallophosphoesterase [Desulfosporosinus sp. BG]ODA39234.1 Purple acid phosphatase/fibronectin domain protein [Desulfosporosinus sp. BG]
MITRRQFLKAFIGAAAGFYSVKFNFAAPKTSAGMNSSIFRFAVISDIHVRNNDRRAQVRFKNALHDLAKNVQPVPDAIIINGDLGNGIPADYVTLRKIIQSELSSGTSIPLFFTIGNHEFYKAYHNPNTNSWSPETFPNEETDTMAIERFLQFTQRDKVYTDTYIKGYHLIFLGSEKSAMSNKSIGDAAYLSSEQLNWLQEKLRENYVPGKPIFIFLHQPALGTSDNKHHFVVQHEELNDILKQYPEVIKFSGHLHLELGSEASVIQDVFTQYNDSSTSRTLDMKYTLVPNKSEGLYVEVFADKVNVKGRDFLKKEWVS